MVQDLSFTVETEQGVRGDPTSSLFPLQGTSDRQALTRAARATSTLSSVLVDSCKVCPTVSQPSCRHLPQETMNFSLIGILPQAVEGESTEIRAELESLVRRDDPKMIQT